MGAWNQKYMISFRWKPTTETLIIREYDWRLIPKRNLNKFSPQVLAQHLAKSPTSARSVVPRCIELAAGRFALPSLVLAASGHCQMMLATDLLGVVDHELPRKYGNLTSLRVCWRWFLFISYLLNITVRSPCGGISLKLKFQPFSSGKSKLQPVTLSYPAAFDLTIWYGSSAWEWLIPRRTLI